MLELSLQKVPSQILKVVLDGQNVQIAIYQKGEGLFVDVSSNDVNVVVAVLARNGAGLICRTYVGFLGELMFVDTQGDSDPTYDGLGDRYSLVYLTAAENVVV